MILPELASTLGSMCFQNAQIELNPNAGVAEIRGRRVHGTTNASLWPADAGLMGRNR